MKSYNLYYRFNEFTRLVEQHGFTAGGNSRFQDIRDYFKNKYNAHLAECDDHGVHYYVLKFNTEKYYSWFLLSKK